MIASLLRRWRGIGEFSVTVPSMDGPLRPNNLVDEATKVADLDQPSDMIVVAEGILVGDNENLIRIDRDTGKRKQLASFDAPIAALAVAPGGNLAIALNDGKIFGVAGGAKPELLFNAKDKANLSCITAVSFLSNNQLLVCNGSEEVSSAQWKLDLLKRGSTGSLWQFDLSTKDATGLLSGMAYPTGVSVDEQGCILVSEAWRAQLLALRGKNQEVVLDNLPAYPGRLSAIPGGGFWLALFAPRGQMMEFVLQERHYCERMIAEIDEANWMAPSLSSGRDPLEPLQGGEIKQLGVHKPWAPSRSYGLIVRLDTDFQPVVSAHCRAGGARHGIVSAIVFSDGVYCLSKGSGELLRLEML